MPRIKLFAALLMTGAVASMTVSALTGAPPQNPPHPSNHQARPAHREHSETHARPKQPDHAAPVDPNLKRPAVQPRLPGQPTYTGSGSRIYTHYGQAGHSSSSAAAQEFGAAHSQRSSSWQTKEMKTAPAPVAHSVANPAASTSAAVSSGSRQAIPIEAPAPLAGQTVNPTNVRYSAAGQSTSAQNALSGTITANSGVIQEKNA